MSNPIDQARQHQDQIDLKPDAPVRSVKAVAKKKKASAALCLPPQ